MKPTKAVYVDWHAPRRMRGQISLVKKSWEIALIIRTTYFSRKYNYLNPVLYCDEDTLEYYKELGIDTCFDEIYPILPTKPDFDASLFWAAGKFLAIQHVNENFIMIDLDAEVRFEIDFNDFDVYCSHVEVVDKHDLLYYPEPEYLDPSNYLGNKYNFKWSDRAYNTALLYFKDLRIAKEYANSAMEFIRSLSFINPAFSVAYILLAEQRFLYDFCKAKGLNVKTLITGLYRLKNEVTKEEAYFEESNVKEVGTMGFLHIWGLKGEFKDDNPKGMDLYKSLLRSRPELMEQIQSAVSINDIIRQDQKVI
jgi:hypothetical protein